MGGSLRSLKQTHSLKQILNSRVYSVRVPENEPTSMAALGHQCIKSHQYTLIPLHPDHDIGDGAPSALSFTFEFSLHPNIGACVAAQCQPNIFPQYLLLDLASEMPFVSVVFGLLKPRTCTLAQTSLVVLGTVRVR